MAIRSLAPFFRRVTFRHLHREVAKAPKPHEVFEIGSESEQTHLRLCEASSPWRLGGESDEIESKTGSRPEFFKRAFYVRELHRRTTSGHASEERR